MTLNLIQSQVGLLPCTHCFVGMSILGSCPPSMLVWTQLRTSKRVLRLPDSSKQAWLLVGSCSLLLCWVLACLLVMVYLRLQFQVWWQAFFSSFFATFQKSSMPFLSLWNGFIQLCLICLFSVLSAMDGLRAPFPSVSKSKFWSSYYGFTVTLRFFRFHLWKLSTLLNMVNLMLLLF